MQRLYRMPSINSYADCVAFYATARRWKSPALIGCGQIGEPKKIDQAGKPYKSLRQVKDTRAINGVGYAWRYHDTDVVTWLTEDSVIVVPWASLSTTSFMEALLPERFRVNMHHPLGCMLGVGPATVPVYPDEPWDAPGHDERVEAWRQAREQWNASTRWYRLTENEPVHLSLDGDKWSVSPTETIPYPQVNAKRAHAARKDFDTAGLGAWLTAILAMNRHVSVRDAQAHALARAGDHGQCLAEDLHANSETGLQFMQEAMRNPELYWAILASPHLRPPQRYSRGGRVQSRTHGEEMQDWLKHMKRSTLLAAYRKHDAVEVIEFDHVLSINQATDAHRMAQRWECDRFNWPVISKREDQ